METVSLRRATVKNVDTLIEIEKKIGATKTYLLSGSKQEIIDEISNKNCFVYLIEFCGKIVGDISYELKNKDYAYISDLMVSPEFQGRGIAKQAMAIVLKELNGVHSIDLLTHPENIKALKIYKSFGFKETGEVMENYENSGQPRIKLTLEK